MKKLFLDMESLRVSSFEPAAQLTQDRFEKTPGVTDDTGCYYCPVVSLQVACEPDPILG
ncbi:MAG TPA: hypothetical protein VFE05_20505 [Longimicrobiaceae bacterium]|jgi:hypothetical protein|nr:hypothetical protein [Longimicrobiaceae bacterium]